MPIYHFERDCRQALFRSYQQGREDNDLRQYGNKNSRCCTAAS